MMNTNKYSVHTDNDNDGWPNDKDDYMQPVPLCYSRN